MAPDLLERLRTSALHLRGFKGGVRGAYLGDGIAPAVKAWDLADLLEEAATALSAPKVENTANTTDKGTP